MAEANTLLGALLNDRYRLLEIVGRGGMATVIKAEDTKHRRQVAIKLFRSDVAQLGGPDRFAREIAILATLQHPNILPLLDSGMIDGQPYYVMPFIQGESLRERIGREGKLPITDAVRLLVEVADALRYAHELGIIHRDIKPENVMLSGRHALVTDFGIARGASYDDDPRHTTAGIAIGTPSYMAPEQAAADPDLDGRADIYSTGILAFEMLTGKPPFAGASPAAILAAQITEMPPPLDEVRIEVSRPLAELIARCLAKKPAERPSATALGDQLEQFVSTSGAVTPVFTGQVAGRGARHPLYFGLAAGAIGLIAALWLGFRPEPSPLVVTATRRLSVETDLELEPTPSPDGRLLAFSAGTNGSLRIVVRQLDGGDAIPIADSVGGNQRFPSWSPDGNRIWFEANGAIYRAPALPGPVELVIEGDPRDPAGNLALAPDGLRAVFTQEGELRLRTLTTGAASTLVRDGRANSPSWSPDGNRIAYVSGNRDFSFGEGLLGNIAPSRILIVSAGGGEPIPITDGRSLATSPQWIDDRTLVFVAGGGGFRDLYVQRLDRSSRPAGPARRLTTGINAHSVRPLPGGTRLAVATLEQSSNIWEVELPAHGTVSVKDAEPVTDGDQIIEDLDVLPLAGWLTYDSNQEGTQDIFLQSLSSDRAMQISRDSTDEFGPAFSPNGKEIAYYAVTSGVRHVHVMRTNGRDVRQVTRDSLEDHQPRWSPDGEALVFYRRDARGRDRIYTVRRNPDSTWADPVPVVHEPGTGASWSSDGRAIAYSLPATGEIKLQPLDGSPARVLAGPALTGGAPLKRPQWIPFEPTLLAREERPGGQGALWLIPVDGGSPRQIVRFDDPGRPVLREDFATDGRRAFFTITELESGFLIIELGKR